MKKLIDVELSENDLNDLYSKGKSENCAIKI